MALKYSEATQSILDDANVTAANIEIAFNNLPNEPTTTKIAAKDGANVVVTAIKIHADTTVENICNYPN